MELKPVDFKDGHLVVYSDVPFGKTSRINTNDCNGCILRTRIVDGKIGFTFYRNSHKHKDCRSKLGEFCHNYYEGGHYKSWKEEVTGVLTVGDI